VVFSPLSLDQVKQMVDLQLQSIAERLGDQGLVVELTDAAREWLAKQGYDPQFGARPLRRALQRFVESPLSVQLLKGNFHRGDVVLVDATEQEGLTFTRQEGASFELPNAKANVESRNERSHDAQ
jgi:ATP-dependent Clp protease ATP-binding subunit ClpC